MRLETAFSCNDWPLRARCRTQIRLWGFDFDAGVLYWCSNGPAAESGEVYLGNIGYTKSSNLRDRYPKRTWRTGTHRCECLGRKDARRAPRRRNRGRVTRVHTHTFRPSRRSGRGGSGFTLIELLVVVSIIAVLISILLPAVAAVQQSAKIAICASNQRQIGIALHSFANENDGKLPEGSAHASGSGYIRIWPWKQPGSFPDVYHQGYITTPQVLFCPDGAWPDPDAPVFGNIQSTVFHYYDNFGWRMFIGYDIYANAAPKPGYYEADEIPNTVDDPPGLVLLTDDTVADLTGQNHQYAHPGFVGDAGSGIFPPDGIIRLGLNVTRLDGSVNWHAEPITKLRYPMFAGFNNWTRF